MKRRGFLGLIATLPFWPFCKQGQAETEVPCRIKVIPETIEFSQSHSQLVDVKVGADNRGEVLFRIETRRRGYLEGCWWTSVEWETVSFDTREVSVATKPNGWYFGPACLCNQDRPLLVCAGTVLKGPGTTPGAMAILLLGIADQNAKLRETLT